MNSDNFFDDDQTVNRDFASGPGEKKLSFFIENNPENKIFLSSGMSIAIGRSIESDFFIENKTVSRNHLKLIRDKEQVKIEILGRNGLYLDKQFHTGSFITIRPPAFFRIGDVSCCLELELDEDKTIIVTSQHREKISPPPPKTEHSYAKPSLSDPAPKPFDPSPIDTFIPPTTSDKPGNVHFHEQATPVSNTQPPITAASPNPPVRPVDSGMFGTNHDPIQDDYVQTPPDQQSNFDPTSFDPIPKKKQSAHNPPNGQSPLIIGERNKLLIAGMITIAAVILVITGFILFSQKSEKSVVMSNGSTQTTKKEMDDPTPLIPEENKVDPNQALIELARELRDSGDPVAAKDVLKDIPKDSAYYGQALRLMEELSEN
jgi:hypothetical protein